MKPNPPRLMKPLGWDPSIDAMHRNTDSWLIRIHSYARTKLAFWFRTKAVASSIGSFFAIIDHGIWGKHCHTKTMFTRITQEDSYGTFLYVHGDLKYSHIWVIAIIEAPFSLACYHTVYAQVEC